MLNRMSCISVETSTLKACLASHERYNGKSSAQRKITALRLVHSYLGEVHFTVKQTLRRFYQHHGQVYGRKYKNNEVKVPYQLVPYVSDIFSKVAMDFNGPLLMAPRDTCIH